MSRTALATSPTVAETADGKDVASASLDELITRGRSQGHLSLAELRAAFSAAGISPADGRSILRELADAGVRLANGGGDAAVESVDADAEDEALEEALDTAPREAAEAKSEDSETLPSPSQEPEGPEADLDDQSPAMGDSVHTYLKAIGRRQLLTAEEEVDLAKRIEAGLYAEYRLGTIEESPGPEDLTEAEHEDLTEIAEDGRRAKQHMLEANLRLVVSVAKKYSDRGMSLLDVVQEGNLGLIRAVEKFDYTKGFKFSTYAMWWIRQAIQRGFADSARTIRLPVHVLELLSKVSRLERDMHQTLGREPTPEELAKELDKTPTQIEELLRVTRQPISLDSTIGEDGETRIGDLIEDIDASEASEVVDRQLMADQLRRALDDLEPREATIMSLRFGLMDGRPRTLDEIGKHLGLTRERIRQLEKQSLSKLRHPSRAQQLLDFAS
ncbi:RNA polymerase sigma factor [Streptomonospora wellingtoniae]|uniref:RNA polymerase sigma factor n=1 Tax=Streptomonospora wellingtoniae TaxID=3075544 RepID=A0ABU2KXL0_9ACTN|nr:RNA polymerase sigma factor [Streptomonospora sp. DSM 45055]MDT0303907.1 RNA polymerase sigma factor [Streptomonospora sp. DSM 45055]